jgi:adenosylcobinamide-GDP ribazoletransferase
VACAGWLAGDGPAGVVRLGLAAVPALLVAAGFAGHCVRRLGGVTGDVLGAGVEVAFGTCLVVLALT